MELVERLHLLVLFCFVFILDSRHVHVLYDAVIISFHFVRIRDAMRLVNKGEGHNGINLLFSHWWRAATYENDEALPLSPLPR